MSSKYQIVIPREARQALGLESGDKLLVVTRGDVVIVMRKPRSYPRAIRGLARGVYREGYLEEERASWK